eukprot:scaffold58740_cov51-Phaeocystis_antarctica.AAC.2
MRVHTQYAHRVPGSCSRGVAARGSRCGRRRRGGGRAGRAARRRAARGARRGRSRRARLGRGRVRVS